MGIIAFKCMRCGNCCRQLLEDTELGRFGLYLLPHEVRLFPTETIAPYMAVGVKGHSRPRPARIVAYQVKVEACPHLSQVLPALGCSTAWNHCLPAPSSEQNVCGIYRKRPLACQAFPLDVDWSYGRPEQVASSKCPVVRGRGGMQLQVPGEFMRANLLLTARIYDNKMFVAWMYPLEQGRWVSLKDLPVEELMEARRRRVVLG